MVELDAMAEEPALPQAPYDERRLEALLAFSAPQVEEKLLRNGKFHSATECHKAFLELMKYLWLTARAGRVLPMPSRAVDEVWHQFILFTEDYHAFCRRFFGGYVHHYPSTVPTGAPGDTAAVQELFRLYLAHFGRLPRVWLDSLTTDNGAAALADSLAWDSLTASPDRP